MYRKTVIVLHNGSSEKEKARSLYEEFKEYIPDELKEKYVYDESKWTAPIPIPVESEAFARLESKAKEMRVFSWKYEWCEYTKEEERNAEYFQLLISDPLQSEGTYARDYGTKYNYLCEKCKIDGELIGDVLVDRKFVKKYDIAKLRPDIFVSKQVRWLIETNGLTGVDFNNMVLDYKGREIPEYHVMSFNNTLPPMSSETWLLYDPPASDCPVCGRKVPYFRSRCCYYTKTALEGMKDFNLSCEKYNNFSERAIIVSKKVKDVFTKAKVRAWFEMVNVID